MAGLVAGTVKAVTSTSQIISGAYELSRNLIELLKPATSRLDPNELHYVFCIQRQIDCLMRPLELCILWCRFSDPLAQRTIIVVEEILSRVLERIRRVKSMSNYYSNNPISLSASATNTLRSPGVGSNSMIATSSETTTAKKCLVTVNDSFKNSTEDFWCQSDGTSRIGSSTTTSKHANIIPSFILSPSSKLKNEVIPMTQNIPTVVILRWCMEELDIAVSQLTLTLTTLQVWQQRHNSCKCCTCCCSTSHNKNTDVHDGVPMKSSQISMSALIKAARKVWSMENKAGDVCLQRGRLFIMFKDNTNKQCHDNHTADALCGDCNPGRIELSGMKDAGNTKNFIVSNNLCTSNQTIQNITNANNIYSSNESEKAGEVKKIACEKLLSTKPCQAIYDHCFLRIVKCETLGPTLIIENCPPLCQQTVEERHAGESANFNFDLSQVAENNSNSQNNETLQSSDFLLVSEGSTLLVPCIEDLPHQESQRSDHIEASCCSSHPLNISQKKQNLPPEKLKFPPLISRCMQLTTAFVPFIQRPCLVWKICSDYNADSFDNVSTSWNDELWRDLGYERLTAEWLTHVIHCNEQLPTFVFLFDNEDGDHDFGNCSRTSLLLDRLQPLELLYTARLCFLEEIATNSVTTKNALNNPCMLHGHGHLQPNGSNDNSLGIPQQRFDAAWTRISDEMLQELLSDCLCDKETLNFV